MNCEATLIAYIQAYERLTEENLVNSLTPLLAENIYFEDPFNQVVGRKSVLKIFQHMFATTQKPRFHVVSYALNQQLGFIRWEFQFYDAKGKAHQILGVSKINFNQACLVQSHIDYWDTGKYIYQKIPLLGWILRRINRLLAAN